MQNQSWFVEFDLSLALHIKIVFVRDLSNLDSLHLKFSKVPVAIWLIVKLQITEQ